MGPKSWLMNNKYTYIIIIIVLHSLNAFILLSHLFFFLISSIGLVNIITEFSGKLHEQSIPYRHRRYNCYNVQKIITISYRDIGNLITISTCWVN